MRVRNTRIIRKPKIRKKKEKREDRKEEKNEESGGREEDSEKNKSKISVHVVPNLKFKKIKHLTPHNLRLPVGFDFKNVL